MVEQPPCKRSVEGSIPFASNGVNMDLSIETPTQILKKQVEWNEEFRIFLALLNPRDRLIAHLLYFTDMTIRQVLEMKTIISYALQQFYKIPDFMIYDLCKMTEFKKSDDFVFIGKRNKPVDRAHLNQAFVRASKKSKLHLRPTCLRKWVKK
jgi:hypothetical protein